MDFLEGRTLSKYLFERYSRNPKGWTFIIAPSRKHGFFDAIVSNREESWQLKIDSIFKPAPLMLGARIDADSMVNSLDTMPYGYRMLQPRILLELLKGAETSENNSPNNPAKLNLTKLLGTLDTVVPEEGHSYAQGPFTFTNQQVKFSDSQKELDDKLSSELHKLFRNRYSNYG
jgi:hypothetical protein